MFNSESALIFASFLSVLEDLRVGLTSPSFFNMLVVACGWILMQGPHAVTEALVVFARRLVDGVARRVACPCGSRA